jgi:hypothetical protein
MRRSCCSVRRGRRSWKSASTTTTTTTTTTTRPARSTTTAAGRSGRSTTGAMELQVRARRQELGARGRNRRCELRAAQSWTVMTGSTTNPITTRGANPTASARGFGGRRANGAATGGEGCADCERVLLGEHVLLLQQCQRLLLLLRQCQCLLLKPLSQPCCCPGRSLTPSRTCGSRSRRGITSGR